MAAQEIAAALQRLKSVLRRRPQAGLHDDAAATARWDGGMRVIAYHDNGTKVLTDMPRELGGSGGQVTPGWLLRAGFASCMLGLADPDGEPVNAGPRDMQIFVRICAHGVSAERLRVLVEESYRCSPMACAIEDRVPVALRIQVDVG
jgi:hypothetical protein